VETLVVQWLSTRIGMGDQAGGVMTSGGTEATYTALLAARNAACPGMWEHGAGRQHMVVVCGEHAHYSVERAVGQLGMGTRNCCRVPSVEYRMDVSAQEIILQRQQTEDRLVVAVVATAGSTATGMFDDLEAIGRICRREKIWFHVDGAHGASAIFSPGRSRFLDGLEFADSLSWDPHKMMVMPLAAGMILVREEKKLQEAFSQSAPYLFHGEGKKRLWDQGMRSFQCSRRNDALKLWMAMQRYGKQGFGLLYDRLCDTAVFFYESIRERSDFETFHKPESNILCFRYVGDHTCDEDILNEKNLELRQLFNAGGKGWITVTKLDGRTALRIVIMNLQTQQEDVQAVADGLAQIGRSLL
jgi:L-2,4-diaminobutyrate decarboxylase